MQIGALKVDSDGSTIKVCKSPDTGAVTIWLYRGDKNPVVIDMRPSESGQLETLLNVANS